MVMFYVKLERFQSTPPARGATLPVPGGIPVLVISIHAPREGGDELLDSVAGRAAYISIHAPREGGDFNVSKIKPTIELFQSTPPARGATWSRLLSENFYRRFQSTPPARGATRACQPERANRIISIHAPREGGDVCLWPLCLPIWAFQSTPPARGATSWCTSVIVSGVISIHAPREGGDPAIVVHTSPT